MAALTYIEHMATNDPDIRIGPDIPSGADLDTAKVSQHRLSERMRQVLVNIGDEIDRVELLSRLYRLERNYRGYWNELCLYGNERRKFIQRYRSAQAAMSKSLIRLQKRGLVKLINGGNGKVVKKIVLTPTGKRVAQMLANNI